MKLDGLVAILLAFTISICVQMLAHLTNMFNVHKQFEFQQFPANVIYITLKWQNSFGLDKISAVLAPSVQRT